MSPLATHAVTAAWNPWWHGMTLYDGIFKGGGAKGILYVGALHELADDGRWFRAVAGSSAGAITATLVAAGFTPDEVEQLAIDGSGKVRLFLLGDLLGQPLFRTGQLRSWLYGELRAQLTRIGAPVAQDAPIRFSDLGHSGIELFVVCVDVVTRQPRVFGTRLTPSIEVVDAVLASCAIPLAFRQGRLQLEDGDGGVRVHRLIDGGVWANYPAFIFRDESFRARHDLGETQLECSLGLAIELGDNDPPQAQHVLSSWGFKHSRDDYGAQTRRFPFPLWAFGRFYLFFALPVIFIFTTIDLIRNKGFITWRELAFASPGIVEGVMGFLGGFATGGSLGRWILYALIFLLAMFVVVMAVVGFTLLDTGRSTFRTMMSVGTGVPYWVGSADNDKVIRLVPPPSLGTFTFRLRPEQVEQCINSAREQTRTQLNELFNVDAA